MDQNNNQNLINQNDQNQNEDPFQLEIDQLHIQNDIIAGIGAGPEPVISQQNNETIHIKQFVVWKQLAKNAGEHQSVPQSFIQKLKKLNNDAFDINHKKITKQEIKFIKQINNQHYDLKNSFQVNQYQTILYDVCSIHFQMLTTINISCMKIRNIEPLQFLSASHVITMQLYGNQIRTLKPLIKNSTMKTLATFTYYFNPICQLNDLFKTNMMKLSHFEYDGSLDCIAVQNLNPLFKNPCNRFKTLYIQSHKRIYQQKINEMLKKKNNEESVYFPNLVKH